jgi:hypothetical protein
MAEQQTPGAWRVTQQGRTFFVVRNRNDRAGNIEFMKRGRGARHFKSKAEAEEARAALQTTGGKP